METFAKIEYPIKKKTFSFVHGLMSSEYEGKYRPFIAYNTFGSPIDLPKDYRVEHIRPENVNARYMGNRIPKSEVSKFSEFCDEEFHIAYNWEHPYVVRVFRESTVLVVRIYENAKYILDDSNKFTPETYTHMIAEYKPEFIFVPDGLTSFGCADEKYHGNSILLKLNDLNYVVISRNVVEFKSPGIINSYYSVMGNSWIPYPVAVCDDYILFIAEFIYAERSEFNKIKNRAFKKDYSFMGVADIFYDAKKMVLLLTTLSADT